MFITKENKIFEGVVGWWGGSGGLVIFQGAGVLCMAYCYGNL